MKILINLIILSIYYSNINKSYNLEINNSGINNSEQQLKINHAIEMHNISLKEIRGKEKLSKYISKYKEVLEFFDIKSVL